MTDTSLNFFKVASLPVSGSEKAIAGGIYFNTTTNGIYLCNKTTGSEEEMYTRYGGAVASSSSEVWVYKEKETVYTHNDVTKKPTEFAEYLKSKSSDELVNIYLRTDTSSRIYSYFRPGDSQFRFAYVDMDNDGSLDIRIAGVDRAQGTLHIVESTHYPMVDTETDEGKVLSVKDGKVKFIDLDKGVFVINVNSYDEEGMPIADKKYADVLKAFEAKLYPVVFVDAENKEIGTKFKANAIFNEKTTEIREGETDPTDVLIFTVTDDNGLISAFKIYSDDKIDVSNWRSENVTNKVSIIDDEDVLGSELYPTTQAVRNYVKDHTKNAYNYIKQLDDYVFEVQYSTENIDQDFCYNYFMTPVAEGDDTFPDDASCTGVYYDGKVLRQYDWYYDNEVEFLVRRPKDTENNKYASLGIATALPTLKKDLVESGEYNFKFKLVPFAMCDGINECGMFIQQNVTPRKQGTINITHTCEEEFYKGKITYNMIPRIVLDNCATVSEVATELARYDIERSVRMPDQYDSHYLIADAKGNHAIIEFKSDGTGFDITTKAGGRKAELLSNFNTTTVGGISEEGKFVLDWIILSDDSVHNAGMERWEIAADAVNTDKPDFDALRTALMYTNVYKEDTKPQWYSEACGETNELTPELAKKAHDGDTKAIEKFEAQMAIYRQDYKNRNRNTMDEHATWQTVHSALYDLKNLTVNMVFQEREEDVKVFSLFETTPTSVSETSSVTLSDPTSESSSGSKTQLELNIENKNKINDAVSTLKEMKAVVDKDSQAIAANAANISKNAAAIENNSSSIAKTNSDVSALKATTDQFASEISTLDSNLNSLGSTVSEHASNISKLNNDVSALETTTTQQTAYIEKNTESITYNADQIVSLKGEVATKLSEGSLDKKTLVIGDDGKVCAIYGGYITKAATPSYIDDKAALSDPSTSISYGTFTTLLPEDGNIYVSFDYETEEGGKTATLCDNELCKTAKKGDNIVFVFGNGLYQGIYNTCNVCDISRLGESKLDAGIYRLRIGAESINDTYNPINTKFIKVDNVTLRINENNALEVISTKEHKIVVTNPELTVSGGKATWTVGNVFSSLGVVAQVCESATNDMVTVDINITEDAITFKMNAEGETVAEGVYRAVIIA